VNLTPTTVANYSDTINDDYRLKEYIYIMTDYPRRKYVNWFTSVQMDAKRRLTEGQKQNQLS